MRVVGTAGHVDHGKSSLVRRLTGIDPDCLAEEKAREMTIDLGFAWLTTPGGEQVGVVDVPGHRDFIENMLAGVGGIDAALLVIAADEGVMPQTREHLAILDLLGIEHGLVVLSKTDLVEDVGWLELVEQDILDLLESTTFHKAEIVRVSAHTGAGIPELLAQLDSLFTQLPPRADLNRPRLPIDRVFTMSGFGTVVTGTLTGGVLRVGDEIELQPTGLRGRVRGLQSYKQAVQVAYPGSRVAVNLSGVEKQAVQRGDVMAFPGQIQPTLLADVRFRYLPDLDRPLRHNTQVKMFSGAAESKGYVRLLDAETLPPGAEGWLQLRLETPLALSPGDRFILRYPSPAQTIGGGVVVNPNPAKRWKRMQPDLIAHLATQMEGSPAQRLAQAAEGSEPLKRAALQNRYGSAGFEDALQTALDEGLLTQLPDGTFWATVSLRGVLRQIYALLSHYHAAEPLRLGMPREELRSRVGLKQSVFIMLLEMERDFVVEGSIVRLKSHQIQFNERQQTRIHDLMAQMQAAPYTPPSYTDAASIVGEKVLRALIDLGEIVQMTAAPDVIFTRAAYDEMVAGVIEIIDTQGAVDAKGLRDRYSASRKYAIGLLEHLDTVGITKRVGDSRVKGKAAAD
ncbi:MAG: selenocysteine-specific translation elongation factor [bacterium]|nr:selenocysteine-specific translation elongation factor [bacterium]